MAISLEEIAAMMQTGQGSPVTEIPGGFSFSAPIPTIADVQNDCGFSACINTPENQHPMDRLVTAKQALEETIHSLNQIRECCPENMPSDLAEHADELMALVGKINTSMAEHQHPETRQVLMSIPLNAHG